MHAPFEVDIVDNSPADSDRESTEPALAIPVDRVNFIIEKLREFDAPDSPTGEYDDTYAPTFDAENQDALEDREDQDRNIPVMQELKSYIDDLTVDEQVDLVALVWLGREVDGSARDWTGIREEAAAAYNGRTLDYLLGTALAADFLEEALSLLGYELDRTRPDGQAFGARFH